MMIYLASPYSHPSPSVREFRAMAAAEVAAALLEKGFLVYSPIVYGHQLVQANRAVGSDWAQWKLFDSEMIWKCDEFWVLNYSGWRESKGVREELAIAKGMGKLVSWVDYKTLAVAEGDPFTSEQLVLPLGESGQKVEV